MGERNKKIVGEEAEFFVLFLGNLWIERDFGYNGENNL